MPLSVNTGGSTWAPAVSASVWTPAEAWAPVKKIKVWRGAGPGWVLSWVHPVVNATLSLSASSVGTGVAYDVVLTAPGGFPEGAAVTFRFTGYTYTVNPAEGATTATMPGASHAVGGTYTWYADVTTKGGNTTFGPVTQSVATASTTTAVSGPTWVFSASESGTGGTATVAQATFTATVSNPAIVSSLSLQLSYKGGAWTEYKNWASPAASQTHPITFNSTGAWSVRTVATQTNAIVIYSAAIAITCYQKDLAAAYSPASPTPSSTVTLTVSYSGDNVGSTSGRWQYMRPADGVWHDNWQTGSTSTWNPGKEDEVYFKWTESFADGSTINSNTLHIYARADAVTVNGGHCHDIQAGMNSAKSAGKALRLTGTFNLYTNVEIPANLSIIATGAKFNCNRDMGGYARPGDAHNAGKFVNGGSGGGYSMAGWFVWDGGTFDGNGEGCFTISHSPGFTIKNATFYRYCANQAYFTWGDGHAIEINSSGGADNGSGENGTFNILIQGCLFRGTDMGQRAWGNDEPMHYDWSWDGSGGAKPHDGTMTHNVRITGCSFHRLSEGSTVSGAGIGGYNDWQWRFAIVAIGGHDPAGSYLAGMQAKPSTVDPGNGWWIGDTDPSGHPKERHNHFKIDNNAIHGATGYAGGSLGFDKGAVHCHRLRQVWVVDNDFYACGAGISGTYQVSGWGKDDIPTYGVVARNTSNSGGHPNTFWAANS